jgi:N-hydroxyarylamine O-acetyltransferase
MTQQALNSTDSSDYLKRIRFSATPGADGLGPTLPTLQALHRAHMLAVPFEDLSIHIGQPIILQEDALFDKIVRRRRGGFCYELNGLFAALLRHLGYRVTLLSAGVARSAGGFGPEFDHLTLLVHQLAGADWLADVGFGDSFVQPRALRKGWSRMEAKGAGIGWRKNGPARRQATAALLVAPASLPVNGPAPPKAGARRRPGLQGITG